MEPKRTLKMLIGLAALVAGAQLIQAQSSTKPTAQAVATVNGDIITKADVDVALRILPPTPNASTDEQHRQIQSEAIDMIVDDLLMRQFLNRNGATIPPAQVDKQMANLEVSLKAHNHTMQEYLQQTAQTLEHLRSDIVKKLQWEAYINSHLTEADVRRYYEANREYYDEVKVQASHILMRLSSNVTDAERQACRDKLVALRQQIVAGQIDFADAAKKYSQCASASRGGDIGYFSRKWAVDEGIAKVAFALKVGEVSEPIQTEYGYHLIKATDRKMGHLSDFDKIKDEVRDNCAMEMLHNLLEQQRKVAKINIVRQ